MKTAVVICPGRGTYTRTELGYLKRHFGDRALLAAFDRARDALGQETLTALDGAASYSVAKHTRGDNASALIYAATLGDFRAIDREKVDIVAVTGNSMVVRIAGLGYQKGFGGHFHNDNSVAVLRDIPGLILACPSNGADAARMLRECVRLAREEQRLVVFLEPIALYPMRDLHGDKDGGWMRPYPARNEVIPFGEVGVQGDGTDIAIVTFGNGFYLSCQAERRLAEAGVKARVIDMRWLSPLPSDALVEAVRGARRILIVDETRRTGGIPEALMALFTERTDVPHARITAEDSFIATGPAYAATMPSADGIYRAAMALVGGTE